MEIDPADFVAEIDNPYLPLEPGNTYVYAGRSDGERERVVLTVLDRTETVMSVECVVVRDITYTDREIAEKTFDWFAQDRFGNVWYFGEDTQEYEDGKPINRHGAWRAGVDGALPGIVMLAEPHVGDRYRQEYYAGEAEDIGQVLRLAASLTVPYGAFDDVLVTRDSTPLEPGVVEHKFYARGVGVILERAVKGGTGQLTLRSRRRSS